jgi:pyruvate dehydrogenase E2 component (dihydrolipoamide acetyltransferase)
LVFHKTAQRNLRKRPHHLLRDEEKTPKYFVAQAAHALANGAAVKDIPLDGLKKKDGLYHLPAGSYSTGRSDAKGNQITLEIPKEGLTLSLEEMQKAMAAKLAVVGVGQPQKTAATAEPAPAEPAKPIHVVHKPADAPEAKPAEKVFTPMAIPPADLKALMAKSYSGLTPQQMPHGLRQTQVTEVQNMLKAAGFDLGKHGADGKCGKDTVEALKAACKAAGIADYKKVNFADPADAELVQLQAHLNKVAKEAAQAKDAPQAAPAAAPVLEAAAPAPAVAAAPTAATEAAPAPAVAAAPAAAAEPAPAPAVAAAPAPAVVAPAAPAAPEPQQAMVAAAFNNVVNSPAFAAMPAMAAAGQNALFGAGGFGGSEAPLPTPDAMQQAVAQAKTAVVNLAAANEATFAPSNVPNLKAGGGHSVA